MLKCKMIHSYPLEYGEVYDTFRGGGTIRKWVNQVERLGRRILERTPDILKMELESILPDGWTVFAGDVYHVRGEANPKGTQIMKEIGGIQMPDSWLLTPSQVAEYIERDVLNKFKGDMLEVLSEIFFTIFHADEGIGITEYTPVELSADYGVDAVGRNVNGHQVAIQVKYRSNPSDAIPYADIARTFTSAVCQMRLLDVVNHDHTIYLLTTAGGVTGAFETVMGKKAVVIARGHLATKIDNNLTFWQRAAEMVDQTFKS